MVSCILKIPLRLRKAASVAQLVEHRFRKSQVEDLDPDTEAIKFYILQAPRGCLLVFMDISVDRLGAEGTRRISV